MQVAHTSDHVTHAVLGGMGATSFGISDSPEFFQILSSALYKDPMLAMIRETICNAWDAHIDSGRTDQPLQITLNDEKLIIRDFGKGIPHDLIGPIYGVYGASTKKNDGRQTGGFGLGCKSPFAYTDHFEVVSFHNGVRTIYNMSKSSAERMGKPSIVPIASFPTEESGIQVTIELKGDASDQRIHGLVQQVIFNGDILALLNGEQQPILGLSKAESGFILLNDNVSTSLPVYAFDQHQIFIRYGNVIYPVEKSSEIEPLWSKISNMLQRVYSCTLVLMAPPDSISITPSRESLTMSVLTVETLKNLLGKFLATLIQNRELANRQEEMVVEYVDRAAHSTDPMFKKLNMEQWHVPGIPNTHTEKFLSTTEDFAFLEVMLRFSGKSGDLKSAKWLPLMNHYLVEMVKNKQLPRGIVQTWMNTARVGRKVLTSPTTGRYYSRWNTDNSTKRWSECRLATRWWQGNVLMPLVQKLNDVMPGFNLGDLRYRSDNVNDRDHHRGTEIPKKVSAVRVVNHTRNLQHFIKPSLVVCHNASMIVRRMAYVDQHGQAGTLQFGTYFVLEIPRAKEEADRWMAALSKLEDVAVLDLTGRLPHEQEAYEDRLDMEQRRRAKVRAEAEKTGKPVIVKKVRPGLPLLSNLLDANESFPRVFTNRLNMLEDPARIKEPAFIAKVSSAQGKQDFIQGFGDTASYAITKLWGDLGAVTNNQGVFDRQREKGIMEITAFVVDKVVKEIAVSPTIKQHMAFDKGRVESYLHKHCNVYSKVNQISMLYGAMMSNPNMQNMIPGFTPLSEEDQLRLIVWKEIVRSYPWDRIPEVKDASADIEQVVIDTQLTPFLDGLIKNEFLGVLDLDNLSQLAVEHRADPTVSAKLAALVQLVIN